MRLALMLLIACLLPAALPRQASAHPMGNFTINHYSALTVGSDRVDILYVIDMAEIPAYQELQNIRSDASTDLTQAERDSYLAAKSAFILKGISLTLDGAPLPISQTGTPSVTFPPGNGGLPTLRLTYNFTAPLRGVTKGSLSYADNNYSDRIGWKEITARSINGTALQNSSVPTTDLSAALTVYKPELINNPPRVSSAAFDFLPGAATPGGPVSQSNTQAVTNWALSRVDGLSAAVADLLGQKDLTVFALLIGLVLAFGFGAGHALSPGHGKTVVAAYLVGSRGTAFDAVFLGLTVTITHTLGVFLLGFVALAATAYIVPEQLQFWMDFISGALIALIGIVLFFQRYRAWRNRKFSDPTHLAVAHTHDGQTHTHEIGIHTHDDAHSHDHDHEHEHAHDHDDPSAPHKHGLFGREHSHLPAKGQPISRRGMLALGISGGILPCPSAVLVLLAAVRSHQIGLGLLLIVAFSLGLATVLTGIGLVMVLSPSVINRVKINMGAGILARLPLASALGVTAIGFVIAVQALTAGGVLR